MTIVRGTTKTIKYRFKIVDPADMVTAYMVIKQSGKVVVERDITSATIDDGKLYWTLTQEESLSLSSKSPATIYLDYVLSNGSRGAGNTAHADIAPTGKDEVI